MAPQPASCEDASWPSSTSLGRSSKVTPIEVALENPRRWNDQYGSVISFWLGGTPVIMLGTAEAAIDLLEKRGDIYSGRPRQIMGSEILSGGMRGVGMPYGPRWRQWRALQTSALSATAVTQYRSLQVLESSLLIRDLLLAEDNSHFRAHWSRFVMSIMVSVTYGRRITSLQDELVLRNQKIDAFFNSIPGKYIVESWPFLLYLPKSLQWFRYAAERQREIDTMLYLDNLEGVRVQMQAANAQPSMATYALEKQKQFGMSDVELAYALSAPWAAGVGTTLATIEMAILALLLYPSVMKKVQEELDNVVGRSRYPNFDDNNSLPYFQAFMKETMRWKPITPTGIPHAVTQDDVYQGMFIPKGSTVYAHLHAIMLDPNLFPQPDVFSPERFLMTDDPRLVNFKYGFGFGRRICPGMHVAWQSMFISLSRLLWTFDVLPEIVDGREVLPSLDDFVTGLVTRPANLRYRLMPRTKELQEIALLEAERAGVEIQAWG